MPTTTRETPTTRVLQVMCFTSALLALCGCDGGLDPERGGTNGEAGVSCRGPARHPDAIELIVDPRYVAHLDYSLSPNGSLVAVGTDAQLTDEDQNDYKDLYLHDYESGHTRFLLRGLSGTTPNGPTYGGTFSGDGKYLLFSSWADNLVPNDTNGLLDTFRYEFATGDVEIVSVDETGKQVEESSFLGVSSDGNLVLFMSDIANEDSSGFHYSSHVFLKDMRSGTLELVNQDSAGAFIGGTRGAIDAAISGDGSTIAFIAPPPDSDAFQDIDELAEDLLSEEPWIYIKETATGTVRTVAPPSDLLWFDVMLSFDGSLLLIRDFSTDAYVFSQGVMSKVLPDYPDEMDAWGAWDIHMTPDAARFVGNIAGYFLADPDHCEDEIFVMDGLNSVPRVVEGTVNAEDPQISADGSTLIFWDETADGEHLALYRMSLR